MTLETIKERSKITTIIRDFFNSLNYLEVETPLLSPNRIPESNIEPFTTTHTHPYKNSRDSYLTPSPEVWLKRFLSKNHINIFEITKCFRNSEQSGKQHNPEFTMIEYYTMDFNHNDTLKLTIKLLDNINSLFPKSKLSKKHKILTMEKAFIEYAGFSLKENNTIEKLHNQASILEISTDDSDDWETAFNRIFIDRIEPNLPKDLNLFLTDFPAEVKTLAKNIPGTPWAQRWELYINGIECGNCYTEESDPEKVETYFKAEGEIDTEYIELFKRFPECSGGAIGLDRLIMAILDIEKIEGVILFPYHDNIR